MDTSSAIYTPYLNVFFVWHPEFAGTAYPHAAALYREFSRDPASPMSPAIGVPMYFFTSATAGVAPATIDLKRAHHNIVVFFVDSSMVLDDAYQSYAQDLAHVANPSTDRLLSFQFPQSGALELGDLQQIVLSQDEGERTRKIRLTFAAECCRLLQHRTRDGDGGDALSTKPPQLFISHAKRDAVGKAKKLKVLIEQNSLDTFFDETHIAAGYDFPTEIQEQIKRSVILAWQSDEYASRPWCNIELITAKEYLRPIVVVLGIKAGEERSFPYLGNVRTIVATSKNTIDIIIAAVREYLRKLYIEGWFVSLSNAGFIPQASFHLFRPPEPIDGALLERKTQEESTEQSTEAPVATTSPSVVLYPDPPLGTTESKVLARLFRHICFTTPATVHTNALDGLKVALSISLSDDSGQFGVSSLHLLSTMVEIARHVLCRGGIIAYGGDLRPHGEDSFTRQLFELVRVYEDKGHEQLERIRNFLAYQVAEALPKNAEAQLRKLAEFHKPLSPELAEFFSLKSGRRQTILDDTAEHRYIRARCLTVMREAMCQATDVRIVMGGRVTGHTGKYPGILEEAYLTLCAKKPLYLLGGFGGCARLLTQALRDKRRPLELTRDYQVAHPRRARYPGAYGSMQEEEVAFEQLEASYIQYEQHATIGQERIDYNKYVDTFLSATVTDLHNGLSETENRNLFETSDLDRIVYLLMKGLSAVCRSCPSTKA
ncbi:MAG: TIR domain-containing protein [Candidatus Binatia bacterium]